VGTEQSSTEASDCFTASSTGSKPRRADLEEIFAGEMVDTTIDSFGADY
jgi:hypothetical protein